MRKSVIACAVAITILWPIFNAKTVRCMACNEAVAAVTPCLGYLTGAAAAKPTAACCGGVDAVNRQATSTEARRDLCDCLEKAAASLHVDPVKARDLPSLCGITVLVPIDPNLNCSTISL